MVDQEKTTATKSVKKALRDDHGTFLDGKGEFMKTILGLLMVWFLGQTAMTDYKCLNECVSEGHMYQYCLKLCAY